MNIQYFRARLARGAVVLAALLLASCGGGGGSSAGGSSGVGAAASPPLIAGTTSYLPLGLGNRWAYQVTDSTVAGGTPYLVQTQISGTQGLSGFPGYVLTSTDSLGNPPSTDYFSVSTSGVQQASGSTSVVNAALGTLELFHLPLKTGETFVQVDKSGLDYGADLDGDGIHETFSIHSVVTMAGFELVTVPAGTFPSTARITTVLTLVVKGSRTGATATGVLTTNEWYASDVGLVQRDISSFVGGVTQTEHGVLLAYRANGHTSDTLAPTVTATLPATPLTTRGAPAITATFSEDMDPSSVNASSFTLTGPAGQTVPGTVNYAQRVATFTPSQALASGAYRAGISALATDLVGNPLALAASWGFTIDATGPTVGSVTPVANATAVPLNASVTINFSEPLDPASVTANSVTLSDGVNPAVPATLAVNGAQVVFTPQYHLNLNTAYTLNVSAAVTDVLGNPLQAAFTSGFKTDPGVFSTPFVLLPTNGLAVAVGDMNGDGRPDVVATTGLGSDPSQQFSLLVFLQSGTGSLATPVRYATHGAASGCAPTSVAIADLNGDGRQDVVVTEAGCGIEVFRQDTSGVLQSLAFLPLSDVHTTRVADLNGDGRLDIVSIGSTASNAITAWFQAADGSFGAATSIAAPHGTDASLELADMNHDGRIDIVTTFDMVDPAKAVSVFLQQPDGTFAPPIYLAGDPGFGSVGLAVGDVNGDGLNDVVIGGSGLYPLITVHLQQASGGFFAPYTVACDCPAGNGVVADMNGDGRNDVVMPMEAGLGAGYLQQGSNGVLQPEVSYAGGAMADTVVGVGDLNGDGRKDIVVAANQYGLYVIYGQAQAVAPAGAAPFALQPKAAATRSGRARSGETSSTRLVNVGGLAASVGLILPSRASPRPH